MLYKLIILVASFSVTSSLLRCNQINKPHYFDFYLMQPCTKSLQNVIQSRFANDFQYCKNLAFKAKGLSFNYADQDTLENITSNCIVYDCPEFNITSVKLYGSQLHYYSSYARIFPVENMTCVPREGIYMFNGEHLNYSNASTKCKKYGGKLVNIITEEATIKVANIIAKSKFNNKNRLQVYVGLNDIEQEGKFVSTNGEPLNCISFRSWAPSEPRNKHPDEDCVTIDSMRYWRVRNCNQSLPYICEIEPNGPLNVTQAHCANIEDAVLKKECYDYYTTSTEIDLQNETCNRTSENLDIT